MKSRFQSVPGWRRVILGVAAPVSRMEFTTRRLMVGVVVIAGSVAGCAKPGPDNSPLPVGTEAVLYEPNAKTVDILVQTETGALGENHPGLVMIPVGTRVRVDNDAGTDLAKDRGVNVTILEGEQKGRNETFRRDQLRPATPPWTRQPGPASDSKTSPSPSD